MSYKNKSRKSEYMKNYRKLHKKEIARYRHTENYINNRKKYRLKHRKEIYRLNKLYRERAKLVISKKLLRNLKYRIYKALKKYPKYISYKDLLCGEIKIIKNYIENNWYKNMNWNNYGKGGWIIHHIIDIEQFNLDLPLEQLKAFSYINLQPMWETEHQKMSRGRPKKSFYRP